MANIRKKFKGARRDGRASFDCPVADVGEADGNLDGYQKKKYVP